MTRFFLIACGLLALTLIAASTQKVVAQQPSSTSTVKGVLAGSRVAVFDTDKDSCELIDIPDAPARAFVDYQGTVHLVSSHYIMRQSIGPTLATVKHSCDVAYNSRHDSNAADFNDATWLDSFYSVDGKQIVALGHMEYHGWEHKGECSDQGNFTITCWYNADTYHYSTDGGYHFKSVKAPRNFVAGLPYQYEVNQGPEGYSIDTNIVKAGDWYYAMATDWPWPPNCGQPGQQQCLFSAPLALPTLSPAVASTGSVRVHTMASMFRAAIILLAVTAPGACDKPATVVADGHRPRPVRVQAAALTPREESAAYSGTVQARVQANLGFRVGGKVIERAGRHRRPRRSRAGARAPRPQGPAAVAGNRRARRARRRGGRRQRAGGLRPLSAARPRLAGLACRPNSTSARRRWTAPRRGWPRRSASLRWPATRSTTPSCAPMPTASSPTLPVEVGQVVDRRPDGRQPRPHCRKPRSSSMCRRTGCRICVPPTDSRSPCGRCPAQGLHGRVREIGALADSASRTFTVKVAVLDPPQAARWRWA